MLLHLSLLVCLTMLPPQPHLLLNMIMMYLYLLKKFLQRLCHMCGVVTCLMLDVLCPLAPLPLHVPLAQCCAELVGVIQELTAFLSPKLGSPSQPRVWAYTGRWSSPPFAPHRIYTSVAPRPTRLVLLSLILRIFISYTTHYKIGILSAVSTSSYFPTHWQTRSSRGL